MHDDEMDNFHSFDLVFASSPTPADACAASLSVSSGIILHRVEEIRRELRSVEREQQDTFIG